MSKQTKPRYRLHRQSDTYVTLGDGDHRLCSICIKKTRGVLDAQLILLVMNSHKNLLAACKMCLTACYVNTADFLDTDQLATLAAAIENAKPK